MRTGASLRGKAPLFAAVGIAVTGGLAALAAMAPAQAATSAKAASHDLWQTAYSTHGGASRQFDDITAPAKNDAWAVADTNTPNKTVTPGFFHWNGRTWSSVIAVLGPEDVWGESVNSANGETGSSTVLTHWNGRTWSEVTIAGISPAASSAGGHAWIMTVDAAPLHVSGEAPDDQAAR